MCGLIGAEELALASIVTATGDDLSSVWAAFAETVNIVQLRNAAEINLIDNLTSTSSVVLESPRADCFSRSLFEYGVQKHLLQRCPIMRGELRMRTEKAQTLGCIAHLSTAKYSASILRHLRN